MKIYLDLDYERGSQVEGGVNLPDFNTWLDDMLQGGTVINAKEEDEEHPLVEEGAAGCLEQEEHCEKEEEHIINMSVTGVGGGHERVQDVQEGGAEGRKESFGGGDGQEAMTGNVKLSVRETVRRLEDGMSFGKLSSSSKQKKSRFVKPRMGRGVKRDGLVQARIESLVSSSGGLKLTGLVRMEG